MALALSRVAENRGEAGGVPGERGHVADTQIFGEKAGPELQPLAVN